jgi:hypothetical protein
LSARAIQRRIAGTDRRNSLIGGIAASAAVRTWAFRVYSFPSQMITIDYLAEKERFVWLARIYLDSQVANYGMVETVFCRTVVTSTLADDWRHRLSVLDYRRKQLNAEGDIQF